MNLNKEETLNRLFQPREGPKVEHEFQEIGLELQKEFGKEFDNRIWPLFHEVGMTEDRVRRALKEFKKRKWNYLRWILKDVIKN